MTLRFRNEFRFEYGRLEAVSPRVRRLVARNPGPFTFHGTNTYVVGRGRVAVIDPGPALPEHVDTLLAGLKSETIGHVLVTHTHRDHSPACRLLREVCAAPTCGFGPHAGGSAEVEEGGDRTFRPDHVLRDGDRIEGGDWTLEAVHTPGHTSNHLCFALPEERLLFTGDHVMGWSTSVISPPDGDLGDYLASLGRLLERDDVRYWPAHGDCIDDPQQWVRGFIDHRRQRIDEILRSLEAGSETIPELVATIYRDLPEKLRPAAARSTHAALLYLVGVGRVTSETPQRLDARFRLR